MIESHIIIIMIYSGILSIYRKVMVWYIYQHEHGDKLIIINSHKGNWYRCYRCSCKMFVQVECTYTCLTHHSPDWLISLALLNTIQIRDMIDTFLLSMPCFWCFVWWKLLLLFLYCVYIIQYFFCILYRLGVRTKT